MTELDLIGLGIWWIPIPSTGAGDRRIVNAWAIEDAGGGVALLDCGLDSPESLDALGAGLADAGASFGEIKRIILSHDHPEHSGGLRQVLDRASWDVAVFASGAEPALLRRATCRVYPLRDGDRFQFRHFGARTLHAPGHTPGLTCLYAEDDGILFSSDHLLHGAVPIATCAVHDECAREAYRRSLERVGALDARVVLPGRGAPFAGHRRVVREVLSLVRLFGHHDRGPAAEGAGTSLHDAA